MSVAVAAPRAVAGLAGQTRAPDEVVTGDDALRRAHATGASWIWVLAHGGDPRPDALERLLGASEGAALVAGAVVDPAGRIREEAVPAFRIERPDVIELAGRGLLPLRHAPLAHCLVAADALTRHGFPDDARFGPYAAIAWSARVLREADGWFEPASVVAAELPGATDWRALARMLRDDAWTRGDRLAAVSRALGRA